MKNLRLALLIGLFASLACTTPAGASISKVNGSVHVSANDSPGDVATVNGSVKVDDGATARDVETVNGSISIGRNATAEDIETVNGGISLAAGARAATVETTNGTLKLAEGARIAGELSAVNGSIQLERAADVGGRVSNVNGNMVLHGAHVGGGLETVNGDLTVGADSRVQGGILLKKPTGTSLNWRKRPPEIVIGPNAVVNGTLRFEQEVTLYVSDRATVGPIEGATAIRFAGDEPTSADRGKNPQQAVEK
jgi:DUF4097 and DUF4098 domain-containing protein YvlB